MQDISQYHRHCPDLPKVLISDAVCLGRRRNRYPQCAGCRFNDDEQGSGGADPIVLRRKPPAPPPDPIDSVFVGNAVRARCPEVLDAQTAWRVGHAVASFLHGALRGLDRSDPTATRMVVGRDGRSSSASLSAAVIEGVRSTGVDVVELGAVDWPQLAFAVSHLRACGGVYTTGGHAPAEYNGFKILGQNARPIGPETGLTDIYRIAKNMVRHDTGLQGAQRTLDLTEQYRGFVRGRLRLRRPLRVVIDAANGMAARWLPVILDGLPDLDLVLINGGCDGTFVHDPNPLVDEHLTQLRAEVSRVGADLGAAFDGDAERLVVVDSAGQTVRSDILLALLARWLLAGAPGATVVYDLRCSRVVEQEIRAAGGVPRRERVGQPYIKKAMAESKAVLGGELSGRYYFYDNACCESAFLALVHVLNMASAQPGSLAEMVKPLMRSANSGLRFFEHPDPNAVIRRLAGAYADARVDYLDGITVRYADWWFHIRRSQSSARPTLGLVVEATTKALMQQKYDEVAALLGEPAVAPAL